MDKRSLLLYSFVAFFQSKKDSTARKIYQLFTKIMVHRKKFSCYFIGNSSLTLHCAQLLHGFGYNIQGIISKHPAIQSWAKAENITTANSLTWLEQQAPCDYLFSIVNEQLLSRKMLEKARYFAINFHDSLLPQYAGMYATSWAILNGETEHGVTWHVMTESLDSGDILKQAMIPLTAKETAFSLNLKCYEQAKQLFAELIAELDTQTYTLTPQNLNQRSYYGRYHSLPNNGFIDWSTSAESIDRLVRALTFGNQENPLGSAKLIWQEEIYLVEKTNLTDTISQKSPGTVIGLHTNSLQIATGTTDILITQLRHFTGKSCIIRSLFQHLLSTEKKIITKITISKKTTNFIKNIYPKADSNNLLCTALLIYFYRITQYKNFTITFYDNEQKNSTSMLNKSIPYTVILDEKASFQRILKEISPDYTKCKKIINLSPVCIRLSNDFLSQPLTNSPLSMSISIKNNKIIFYTYALKNSAHLKNIFTKTSEHLCTLLRAVSDKSQSPISNLPLLSKKEKETILRTWNKTKSSFSHHKPIHRLFEEQTKKTKNSIAACYNNQSITYENLNKKSNQLARFLKKYGVKKQSLVAICYEKNIELIIILLAVIKVGGTYIPIDKNSSVSQQKKILNDCRPCMIITQKKIKFAIDIPNIVYPSLRKKLLKESPSNLREPVSSENPIYILYTSGSTGIPKGVCIYHFGLVNTITAQINQLKINEKTQIASIAPFSFDAFAWEMFSALISGASLYLAKTTSPVEFSEFLRKYQINLLTITPSVLTLMQEKNLPDLSTLILMGEACPIDVANRWAAGRILINAYGPTETSICATMGKYNGNNILTIGKPIANTQVYVLDKNLQPLPIGFAGELHIGGVGLARGYLNRPELTAEKFIKNPFSKDPEARLYKTGDLVRWLPNGELEYLGRLDHQVKIRGFRVELGEVEHVLLKHPDIAQATVIADRLPAGHQQLIAYIVTHTPVHSSKPLTTNILQAFLSDLLPHYMIPAIFVALEELPLNANGKVDRKILLALKDQALPMSSTYSAPENNLEKNLVALYEKILKKSPVGIEDGFFALGGDSILAMQLIAEAHTEYGYSFSVETLFTAGSIKHLSEAIEHKKESSFVFEEETKGSALTPIEQWFFAYDFVAPAEWSQVCLISSTEPLDQDALIRALHRLISEHDALNLCYQKNKNTWKRRLKKEKETSLPFIFEYVKLTTPIEPKKLMTEWGQALQTRFHLTDGPLIAVAVFHDESQTANDHVLWVIHHLLVDGVSWRILLKQFNTLYQKELNALKTKTSIEHDAPASRKHSFNTWSSALCHLAHSDKLKEDETYWLAWNKKGSALPVDHNHGENTEKSSATFAFQLGPITSLALLSTIDFLHNLSFAAPNYKFLLSN